MTEKMSGYGRRWKKWLWIYLAAGAVAYLVVYLVFFHHGGGGTGFGYCGANDRQGSLLGEEVPHPHHRGWMAQELAADPNG